ncbi:MAG: hypothetical protein EXR52_06690 [Dehalococcoidia bacterium]|nr:hypothetical protein [Dehalococcoidia bacterium]
MRSAVGSDPQLRRPWRLGFQIQIALDDLLFSRVATCLLVLVALILAVDTWSSHVRRRLTQ